MALTKQIAADDPDAKPPVRGLRIGRRHRWPAPTGWRTCPRPPRKSTTSGSRTNPVQRPAGGGSSRHHRRDPQEDSAYVNGGFGDVNSIATTTFQDGGQPILTGGCYLHRRGVVLRRQLAGGHRRLREWRRVGVLLRRPSTRAPRSRSSAVASSSSPSLTAQEVQAFQTYLSSADWANEKGEGHPERWLGLGEQEPRHQQPRLSDGPAVGLDAAGRTAVFRFDGSDMMPPRWEPAPSGRA